MTLPKITTRQQEILNHILQFRFIDRTHLQIFLHHKDKQQINRWLKDLVEKGYIGRIYSDKIIGENRIPAIYFLDTNGVRYIKSLYVYDETSLRKLYYENDRSDDFISQSLLIASICSDLRKRNTESAQYEYLTESDFSQSDSSFHFLKENDVPLDLFFSKKQKGKKKRYYLLSIFPQSFPRYRIRKRIRSYIDFYANRIWEDHIDIPFPTLLIVCETKELMIYTKRYTRTVLQEQDETDLSFHFAPEGDVRKYGVTGEIWEKV